MNLTLLISIISLMSSASIRTDNKQLDKQNCTWKGMKLYGRIKIVENFPDIKVKVVENFPDMKVKLVSNFPDHCGEWKLVENFPDLKIQIVENFPDVKIQFVENFPGMQ